MNSNNIRKYSASMVFFNEESLLDEFFVTKTFPVNHDKFVQGLLAKHIVDNFTSKPEEVKKLLIGVLKRNYPGFDVERNDAKIDYAVETGLEFSIRKPVPVPITKSEIDVIKYGFKTESESSIAFVGLVMAKYKKLSGVFRKAKESDKYYLNDYADFKYLPEISGIKDLTKVQAKAVFEKYPKYFKLGNKYIQIAFAENAEPIAYVNTSEDIAMQYTKIIGEFTIPCMCCGATFEPTRKSNIYCPDCSGQYKPMKYESKVVSTPCCDCGAEYVKKSNNQVRCESCSKTRRLEKERARQQNLRDRRKMDK